MSNRYAFKFGKSPPFVPALRPYVAAMALLCEPPSRWYKYHYTPDSIYGYPLVFVVPAAADLGQQGQGADKKAVALQPPMNTTCLSWTLPYTNMG